ncbi:MFS transporter [Streptomyces sp. bgisy153]|uniref:MFS transporter n=1 Tax=Streptomyces sp. bgisy153 TaxID=3413793 RepID=UPI003D71CC25
MTATVAVRRAAPTADRRLLTAVFAVLGAVMAVFGARMPAVQAAADLGPGRLAVVLFAAAAGMVAGLRLGSRLADRHGPSRLLVGPAAVFGGALALLGQCTGWGGLMLMALVFGLAHGLLDVGVNCAAVNVQRAYGRPIMAGLHACYSLGALAGAAVAALSTSFSHRTLFAVVGVLTALAALAAVPLLPTARHLDGPGPGAELADGDGEDVSSSAGRRAVWLLGALAAACLLGEGAAADWAAVHLRSLEASERTAAVSYALYSAAMAAGRLSGDRLIARFGAPAVVRAGAAIAAAGLGAGVMAGSAPAALLGWMAFGLGLSTAVPSLITAAGRGGPRAVGAVAATGYVGLLLGPAVIGALASLLSLSAALALPVALAAVVAVLAYRSLETR